MAYTATDFAKDLALYTSGAVIGVARTRKFVTYAAKKGIRLGALTASRAAIPAARAGLGLATGLARRNPYIATGLALGGAYGAGAFEEQEEELRRRAFESEMAARQSFEMLQEPGVAVKVAKRKLSKYNQAIKAGMKVLKSSSSNGSKGKISNTQAAMKTVSKIASAINKGKSPSKKGITGKIGAAVRKVLPKKKPVRRRTPTSGKQFGIKVRKY